MKKLNILISGMFLSALFLAGGCSEIAETMHEDGEHMHEDAEHMHEEGEHMHEDAEHEERMEGTDEPAHEDVHGKDSHDGHNH